MRSSIAAALLAPALAYSPLALAQVAAPPSAGASSIAVGLPAAVHAERSWARATAPGQSVGGAYVTLTSPSDDRVVSATSPVAAKAELHEMSMDGGVMRMRELPNGLALPAHQAVALAPGGIHLMLVGLKQPLAVGQTIAVQLRFLHGPPLDLNVQVAPVGARGPGLGIAHTGEHAR